MLTAVDLAFTRRDPAIPGLSLVLDPEAMRALLASHWPSKGFRHVYATYTRYKPGTSCLVAYRLEGLGGSCHGYAKAYRFPSQSKMGKLQERNARRSHQDQGVLVLPEPAVAIWLLPHDHDLPVLARLHDPGPRPALLQGLLPGRPDLWSGSLELLRYKPERRYVALLHGAKGSRALLKAYSGPRRFQRATHNAKGFQSMGPLRVARRLGRSHRHRLLALEWQDGQSLDDLLHHRRVRPGELAMVGHALATLHAQQPRGLASSPDGAAGAAHAAIRLCTYLCPWLAETLHQLGAALASQLQRSASPCCAIHGDFSADQVLLNHDHAILLDLDSARWGHPSEDLGAFVAGLELAALLGDLQPGLVRLARASLLAGYRESTGGPTPSGVCLHTAVGLLRLAPLPFRQRHPDWPRLVEAAVRRVTEIVTGDTCRGPASL